jgi:bifunctional ADP-heptose synthase (sugar kinase/adenylyltransferase)
MEKGGGQAMRDRDPLTGDLVEQILGRIPSLTIAVLGDLFLDRYLDLDATLTEPSIETGLDAYQVVRVRSSPGAAGTILNNLVALGVGRVCPVAVIGDDGEGYELRQALTAQRVIDLSRVFISGDVRTPTYTKPMLHERGKPARELNRLDIKNRRPLPEQMEQQVLIGLEEVWAHADALLVLDQVSEADCGVVTARVRQRLAELGASRPDRFVLADSRERIGLFRNLCVKPNQAEGRAAVSEEADELASTAWRLARQVGGAVFCTLGDQGTLLIEPEQERGAYARVSAYPVAGPIDPVGAGDSTSAAIACAVASGATREQAAAFGNLVASITIQQIGTTGTASPEQVRRRWQEVRQR